MWREKNFRRCWWEGRMVQPVCKTVWRVFKKLKLKLPHDPAISLQEYISEENKNTNSKIYMDSNVCTTLFTITKIWKQSKCPAGYELIKINYTHTHIHTHTHTMEYHSPTEKSEYLPFVKHGWNRRIFTLSEINQKNTNTYCMLSFISGLLKTKQ